MNASDIRLRFVEYFKAEGHQIVSSASLVPDNDPTLFFTNAGMVQFKDVFTGREKRPYSRATTAQKCLRVSGKHNDLENVGRTPRHHTFFEMLGNFSFGDYFKRDAIRMAWAFLTEELGIDKEKLWVTVYEEDDEAEVLWREVAGVPAERIQRLGAKDNFWSMGDTGPCGPCSEIFYDHGPEHGEGGGPETESDRYIEIWNLVFMQFDRSADGKLTPLPNPSIDTGMGLERVAAVMQGVYSNYDTDCFKALVNKASQLAGITLGENEEADVALRVIADHARATGFLIADGVMPSNEERGYVLRRVMRRAIRYGVKVGLNQPFLGAVVDTLIDTMGDQYAELNTRADFIREVVKSEENRFRETLDKGLNLLDQAFLGLADNGELAGDVAFKLHDTFGFPLDLTSLIAEERGYTVDQAGYSAAMEAQRAAGRAAWKGSGEEAVLDVYHRITTKHPACTFLGYDANTSQGTVIAIVCEGQESKELAAGQAATIITDKSPFYGESGGQVGDVGTLSNGHTCFMVADTQRPVNGLIAHRGTLEKGEIKLGDTLTLEVDATRRDATRLNHTATHLLHSALQTVLGDHVMQKGSMVNPERLRFDFSHHKAVTKSELAKIESMVYQEILRNQPVTTEECSMDDAIEKGAMALFGEKYGEMVRVVDMAGFSIELCGGTHAVRTGDIGLFRITNESSVAAGVRRIEAETGLSAVNTIKAQDQVVAQAAVLLKSPAAQFPEAISRILEDRKRLSQELDKLKRELARAESGDLTTQARDINGIQVLAAEVNVDAKALRDEADRLRDILGCAVVVLGSREGGSVKLVVTVSKEIAGSRVHAGNLIRQVAGMVGGGGGGRPDMAQAGGKNPEALPEALAAVYGLIGA